MSSPTARSLKLLRDDGWLAEVVEKWNPHSRTRKDLFGVVDILAIKGGQTLAVQSTSYSNVSSRVNKIAESPTIAMIREAGWSFIVHGWKKRKQGKVVRWECREVDVS